ncbi:MAG: hypothetical protein ACXWWD_12710, partial [Chitinophagaceae bacterium]
KENQTSLFSDSTGIIKMRKVYQLPNKMKVWESSITDTGSSRTLRSKTFYKNGIGYTIAVQADTLSQPSSFVKSFFDSFSPVDTLLGSNPFSKKADLFFADFMSRDSVAHKRALKNVYAVKLDSTDLPQLKRVISSLDWKEKKYLDTKKLLIGKLDNISTKQASDYLQELYYAAGDTIDLQHSSLEVLLQQKTRYAFNVFRDIMTKEPPVLNINQGNGSSGNSSFLNSELKALSRKYSYDDGSFMDELMDSLKLTGTILPGLLPLINLDDYKQSMMQLLAEMVDSNLAGPNDYDMYFSKFLIEAKQELKKQAIAEKQKAIEKAEQGKVDKKTVAALYGKEEENNSGNEKLRLYATLLMPYWETNPAVRSLFDHLLLSTDKRIKYTTLLLLLRNNKPAADSLVKYFAALDDYRYELYTSLKAIGKEVKFPAQYNNHIDLAKSKLMAEKTYDRPDSLVYVDRLPASVKDKKGSIYFFKYKTKKDDASWKIAIVGLVPENPSQFEFDKPQKKPAGYFSKYNNYSGSYNDDFTQYTDTKIREDETEIDQLKKELKRLLYSRRKSAKEFYDKSGTEYTYQDVTIEYEEN